MISADRANKLADEDSVYGALLTRLMTGFARVAREIPEAEVTRLLAADSALETALAVLERPDAIEALKKQDPLAAARVRGVRAVEHLLSSEGGTLAAEEVAHILGITRQAVDKRRKNGRLIGLAHGRAFRYPAWQFREHATLPGLERALLALGGETPWAQMVFFLGESPRLEGKRPIDALRRGAVTDVLEAVGLFGEQGAA